MSHRLQTVFVKIHRAGHPYAYFLGYYRGGPSGDILGKQQKFTSEDEARFTAEAFALKAGQRVHWHNWGEWDTDTETVTGEFSFDPEAVKAARKERKRMHLDENPAKALHAYTDLMQPAQKQKCGKAPRKSGNPKLAPYASDVPFELVDYERLIPPTYDIENEDYAHDIAHSMQASGWTGRPLWGMEMDKGFLDMRTGSHRYFALGLLLENGEWPANLPFGMVPVYVMRRSAVPSKVWRAWEAADFWEMKELGEQGIGPEPVVKLMRAERNPASDAVDVKREGDKAAQATALRSGVSLKAVRSIEKSSIRRAYEIAVEHEGVEPGMLAAWVEGWCKGFGTRNPAILHEPTPATIYELWDVSIGAGKRVSVHFDRKEFNEAKRQYWGRKPLAELELREIRTDQVASRNPGLKDFAQKQLRDTFIAIPSGLVEAAAHDAQKLTRKNVTDRALRYRANHTPPEGPRRCLFCSSTRNVEVGHLDGHEENNAPENLVWNCKSCNAILAARFKELGLGRRTRQYNPVEDRPAISYKQFVLALSAMHGDTNQMTPEQGISMIHATPQEDRVRFQAEAQHARRRAMRGRSKQTKLFRKGKGSEVPF